MNVTEIRKLIRQSEHKEWYNSQSIKFNYPHANFKTEIKGFDFIYQFLKKQKEFYHNLENVPSTLNASKTHFNSCISNCEQFVNKYLKSDSFHPSQNWANLRNIISKSSNRNNYYFNKESEVTDFIISLNSQFEGSDEGAYAFFTKQQLQYNQLSSDFYIGWQRAYEFTVQNLELIKRRDNERRTLSRIRSEYITNLEENDKNVRDHIAEKKKQYLEKEKAISRLIQRKNRHYESWKSSSKEDFNTFINECKKNDEEYTKHYLSRVKELEELYNAKLGLQAPADYWEKRAKDLDGDGKKWRIWLISSIVVSVLILVAVIFLISLTKLEDLFSNPGSAIRFSILFIALMSVIAYAIKVFSKLMISSYHLKRDALERKQLAYFYLALKSSGGIEKEERHLIIQSLFSRSDSGLLKDDSGPSMPGGGDAIGKIIKGGK